MRRRKAWPRRVAVNEIKDADFAVLDEISKPGASLDARLPAVDWSADKDMLARLDDWSAVDKMFARLDDWSAVDKMFAHLDDWSTLDAMFPADLMLDKLDGLLQPID